jgi:hypothetical protein
MSMHKPYAIVMISKQMHIHTYYLVTLNCGLLGWAKRHQRLQGRTSCDLPWDQSKGKLARGSGN